ncbi:MAG: DUF1552 domain-containing protein [Polyangiaceae bacterium]
MNTRMPNIRRRTLLQGLGLGAGVLPFLRHIPSAAAAPAPKRLVVFFTPNESIDKAHWDPGVASGAALPAALPTVFSPLLPYKSKLLMVGDLDDKLADGGHGGIGSMLTGRMNQSFGSDVYDFWSTGISVDQHIAQQWGTTPLTLGALPSANNGGSRISYTGPALPVSPYEDPLVAFEKVFGDPDLSDEDKAKRAAQQAMVLDSAALQLGRIKGKLPQVDAAKLEHHLEGVLALRAKLDAAGATCAPNPLVPGGGYDYKKNAYLPQTVRMQIDVLVQALACGTRVGSLQIGNTGASNITPVWPSEGIDIGITAHNISHNYNDQPSGADKSNREALEIWYVKQLAYLLDGLASVDEGDGTTLLDNTVVLWTKGFATKHKNDPLFYMLIGGGGGALDGGRYLSFPGKPHNNLLASLCQMMDLDDEKFGDPAVCTGALDLG